MLPSRLFPPLRARLAAAALSLSATPAWAESNDGAVERAGFPLLLFIVFAALLPFAWRCLRGEAAVATGTSPGGEIRGGGQVAPARVLAWHVGARGGNGLADDGLRLDPRLPEALIGDIGPLSESCGALTAWCDGHGAGWSWRFEIVPEGDAGESGSLRVEAHGRRRLPEATPASEERPAPGLDGSVAIGKDTVVGWVLWSWDGRPEGATVAGAGQPALGPARRRLEAQSSGQALPEAAQAEPTLPERVA